MDSGVNPAVTVVPGKRNPDIVLLCEHSGKAIPSGWGDLGIREAFLDSHFGSDIGAADLTAATAFTLGATAIMANYSRLFLDYNRKPSDPDCYKLDMGGIPIPGNLKLCCKEIGAREKIAREPVEKAIALWTEKTLEKPKAIISIHSFSPVWNNTFRSCEIGVMWRDDSRLSHKLIRELSADRTYIVRDNEPYDFRQNDWFTLDRHGLSLGLQCAYIEVRNDLIDSSEGVKRVSKVLASAITASCL
jgi:predicted N-formylglutamate amidohydrolase